jgi:hypothetical protein
VILTMIYNSLVCLPAAKLPTVRRALADLHGFLEKVEPEEIKYAPSPLRPRLLGSPDLTRCVCVCVCVSGRRNARPCTVGSPRWRTCWPVQHLSFTRSVRAINTSFETTRHTHTTHHTSRTRVTR